MALWQKVLWFSLGYFACAVAGNWLSAPASLFVTFWVPSGFAVAVFLLSDTRDWRWLTLAMVAANLSFNLWQGTPALVNVMFCVANALETITSAWLIRRFIAPWPALANLRELIGILAFAVVLSPMLGAAIAAATMTISGMSESFGLSWFLWWTSEAMAIVLVTPFILAWWSRSSQDPLVLDNPWQLLEAAALICVSFGMTAFILMSQQGVLAPIKAPLLLPLVWAALRFGPRGATVANLLLALPVAFFTTQYSIGVTPEVAPGDYGPGLQIALVVGAMVSLIPAVVFRTYDRTIQELHDMALRIQQLNRVHSVTSEINQAIVREQDGRAMLTAACRIAVEKGRFRMAWAGTMDATRQRLELAGHAGASPDTLELVNELLQATDEGARCAITLEALQTGRHGICNDIDKDPRMARWREAARQREYRAMTSLPLKSGERVVGTFNLYAGDVDFFDADEMQLLDELAADISFALEIYAREAQRLEGEAERKKAEADRLALNARYARHEAALTTLARAYVALPDNLGGVLKEITEVVARTLEVERVSIWRYDQGHTAIVCTELFESAANRHSSGMTLSESDYPAYFQALAQSDIIAAGDAFRDPRTAEFGDSYLRPLGISSMLDTPVRSQGAMVGIVCCEHIGAIREWTPDEQTFVVAVASLVSALLAQVERHQLEAQLRQAQKMEAVGKLAGGVAHDFNNVLAVIQMQAGLLQDEPGLPPIVAESALEIEKATERAANLTRQLLLFSRRETLQPRDLDLNEVISHITQMLQRLLGENIRLQLRQAPEPLLIRADAGMMDQILMNLTVNSRDAMPKGGHLVIESSAVMCDVIPSTASAAARPGPYVCLSVTDSGSGIPAEALPRIFEPFFTTKDVGKGTGLGLATVFGIIEQHQGWIDVESEPGRGTTFRVYLPRLLKSTDPRLAPVVHEETVRGGTETILVVEDDSALRLVVCNALSRLGYRVIEASSGVRALDVWRRHRDDISVMLTDMVMPDGVNGKELAEIVKRDNPGLKVIYSSGYSADVAGDDFPLIDGVNFLAKPFAVQRLAQMVRECLDRN